MVRLPEKIAYAKNATHNQFLHSFEGKVKGRYLLAFLVGIGFVGGTKLRQDIETDLGNPAYILDEWYPGRDVIFMFDRAVRSGLSPERIGLLSVPAYKRANPTLFEGKTARQAFELLDQGLRSETSYAFSPTVFVEATRALVHRRDAPIPCGYMVGLLKGLLDVVPVHGTVQEIECQWDGVRACRYEACWTQEPVK